MFYVKADIAEGVSIKVELGENIYNLCPICGKECAVDLEEAVTKDGLDLYHTEVCCDECWANIESEREKEGPVHG